MKFVKLTGYNRISSWDNDSLLPHEVTRDEEYEMFVNLDRVIEIAQYGKQTYLYSSDYKDGHVRVVQTPAEILGAEVVNASR
jgi:hypothetical protein